MANLIYATSIEDRRSAWQKAEKRRRLCRRAQQKGGAAQQAARRKRKQNLMLIGGGAALVLLISAFVVAGVLRQRLSPARSAMPRRAISQYRLRQYVAHRLQQHAADLRPALPRRWPRGVHTEPIRYEHLVHNLEDGGVVIYYQADGCPNLWSN